MENLLIKFTLWKEDRREVLSVNLEMFVWNLENNSKVDFIPGSHTSGV